MHCSQSMFGGGALAAKMTDLGFWRSYFELHSSATERKNSKARFPKRSFAAQMVTSKHVLKPTPGATEPTHPTFTI